jgi:hypothetical protein
MMNTYLCDTSEDQLCQGIALIKQQWEPDHKFSKALDLVGDGHYVFGVKNAYQTALMDTLHAVFADIEGEREKEIKLETPEQLYYLLLENKVTHEKAAAASD